MERDDAKKTVVGLTVVKDEVPESNVELHIAACVEVVRGKMGADTDIMVYTNKQLNTSEDTMVKDMVLTSWQGISLFTSTPEIESRKLSDGGIVLKTPVSNNCTEIKEAVAGSVQSVGTSGTSTEPEYSAILGDIEIPEGVDPSFLATLPEYMRQEVIEEQRKLTLARHQLPAKPAAAAGAEQEVNPEFLAALPPNIKEEVLAQQRMEQLHQRQGSQSIKEATDDMLTEDRVVRTMDRDSLAVSLELSCRDDARSDTESDHDDNPGCIYVHPNDVPNRLSGQELQEAEIKKSMEAIQVS